MQLVNQTLTMRGVAFLQSTGTSCDTFHGCQSENTQALTLLLILSSMIATITVLFAFFREDKEEQITPLCPQLVVSKDDLRFSMDLAETFQSSSMSGQGATSESTAKIEVLDSEQEKPMCSFFVDWMDPFRQSAGGVAATVRLQSNADTTLATVVARNIPVVGQGLALCRTGCEIFGFVEPKGNRRYDVRHRTGVHLLTLTGEFGTNFDIEGVNPVGSTVCWFKNVGPGAKCEGRVLQNVDAGLVISSILATQVHRRLIDIVPATPAIFKPDASPAPQEISSLRSTPRADFSDLDPEQAKEAKQADLPEQGEQVASTNVSYSAAPGVAAEDHRVGDRAPAAIASQN